ncbi:MAG: hypothetical protein CVV51_14170, partial [Spirochaetae bacterium HGW-Spirochaetae-7]
MMRSRFARTGRTTRFKPSLGVLMLVLASTAVGTSWALTSDLVSSETTVVLRPDGKADVYYVVEWNVTGGDMSGFYFQGEAFKPVWNLDRCWADLPGGVRQPLLVKDLGNGRYDVILSAGRRFSGRAYYSMNYAGDFAAAGLVGTTTSPEHGDLVYFDWAPVEWDEVLEYRAVRLVLPVRVSGEKLSEAERAAIPMLTEEWVNAENRIDYYGSPGDDGAWYLTILFYQESPRANATQRLGLYFPAGYLPLSAGLGSRDATAVDAGVQGDGAAYAEAERTTFRDSPVAALIVFALVIAAALLLYARRVKAFAAKAEVVEGIAWAGDAWNPPKLFAGTYQVPGKVPENLHPVEAALLLELALPRIAAIMVDGLEAQGLVAVDREDPLKLRFLSAHTANDEIEESFLASFDAEGNVLPGLLADFFEGAIKRLQEKIWDCDLEATKAFYRRKILEAQATAEEVDGWDETRRRGYYRSNAAWMYWRSYAIVGSRTDRLAAIRLPEGMSAGYADFMRSAVCYSGCFTPASSGTVDACYSACHN